MEIRNAGKQDCKSIAELAMMAGEGIPAYFWKEDCEPDQDILDVGAGNAASETDNFSYRNTVLAIIDNEIAGMLLAYKLPSSSDDDLEDYPEFIRPLIALEQCVPESYYINMVATYPSLRNKSVGTTLLNTVTESAKQSQCTEISIQVFEQNHGALSLYHRLGYQVVERRRVIPHSCHPYTGDILLLTKDVE